MLIITIPVALLMLLPFSGQANEFSAKQLSVTKMKKVALMSDMDAFRLLLGPVLRERVSDTEGNRAVQKHIIDTMKSFGWTIQEDSFVDDTPFGQKNFNNIVASMHPEHPRKLTLACHFDSKYFPDFTFIGAIDSAVPCAMLLDIARTFNSTLWHHNNCDKDVSLQFIFFDGEEAFVSWSETDSLYGSRHLAAQMQSTKLDRQGSRSQLDSIELLLLLDLIGSADIEFKSFFKDTESQFERLKRAEKSLRKQGLLDVSLPRNQDYFGRPFKFGNEGIGDDHIPFYRRGVPILHLISLPFPSVWHTSDDNESALHYPTIDNLNKIIRIFVAEYLNISI